MGGLKLGPYQGVPKAPMPTEQCCAVYREQLSTDEGASPASTASAPPHQRVCNGTRVLHGSPETRGPSDHYSRALGTAQWPILPRLCKYPSGLGPMGLTAKAMGSSGGVSSGEASKAMVLPLPLESLRTYEGSLQPPSRWQGLANSWHHMLGMKAVCREPQLQSQESRESLHWWCS